MDKKQVRYYIVSEEEVRKKPRTGDAWLFGKQTFTKSMLQYCGREIDKYDFQRIVVDDSGGGGYGVCIFGTYNINLDMIEVKIVRRERGRIKIRE